MSVYLITGAAGYIGSMLTEYLLENDRDSQIIAMVRDMGKSEKKCSDKTGRLKRFEADLYNHDWFERFEKEVQKIDYMIHCASVTQSQEMIKHPVEVIQSIVNGTQHVLEMGKNYKIRSMVYLSSMKVYGSIDCAGGLRVTEQEADQGSVEIFNVRSCYPLGKRMAENLCYSYYKEYGVPVKIARLAQIFGRGILPSDSRVFVRFARAAKTDTDIILHTDGTSVGNYCSIDDALTGILTILKHGQDGEAYNVVNEENTMTIRQMAELVRDRIAGGRIEVTYNIPGDNRYGYASKTGLRLSGEKLSKLGWYPMKSLAEMYQDLMKEL